MQDLKEYSARRLNSEAEVRTDPHEELLSIMGHVCKLDYSDNWPVTWDINVRTGHRDG